MDYQKHYDLLMERAKTRAIEGYSESHHIIPSCIGGPDSKDNLVDLTPEEHFVAHQLLTKIYPSNHKLIRAATMMAVSSEKVKRTNKLYGWLRRKFVQACSGDNHWTRTNPEAALRQSLRMKSEDNPQKKNPRRGKDHHYFGVKNPITLSNEGRARLAMPGDKNPAFGKFAWEHPTCFGEAKQAWWRADEAFAYLQSNPSHSFSRVSKALGFAKSHQCGSVVTKIKSGWNPLSDPKWLEWKQIK
jgi:hypothetical protein